MHAQADPEVEGVYRIATDARLPRPHVAIFAAIHGNERCGLAALAQLRAEAERGALPLRRGTLVLVHGNPEATRQGQRHTRGGHDLNRLFDFGFEEELPSRRWAYEHRRALELRSILEGADVLLDLHSAGRTTPPFAILNRSPEATRISRHLGFRYATIGWESPGLLMDKVTIGAIGRHGRPGLSVECGQHEAPEAERVAIDVTERFLHAVGALPGEAPASEVVMLKVEEIIGRPSEGFRFVRPIQGLERLEAGEVLAADSMTELRVKEPCYVLMPNDTVPVGEDMAFLAREVRSLD